MSVGRIFRIREGMSLSLRAEFDNVFNRVTYPNAGLSSTYVSAQPLSTSPPSPVAGLVSQGYFGSMNPLQTGAVQTPRTGQIIMRLNF
jgi:hypothetical protein